MLLGTYEHTLDVKNRIVIPSRLTEELHGKLYLYPAITVSCIKVYNKTEWDKFSEMIFSLPQDIQYNVRHMILPFSLEIVPDSQNRVPLTQGMLDKAKITDREIYFIEMGEYCEIWNRKLYDAQAAQRADEETTDYIRKLGL